MFKWVDVPDNYLDYLRNSGDKRIPYKDYGTDKFKPFFGILFTSGKFAYITQISHPQKRHFRMKEAPDFIKIFKGKRLLCVVNLNYMFPVPLELLTEIEYANIEKYRNFNNDDEKSQYIYLLRKELQIINTKKLSEQAKEVYNNKYLYPNSPLSQRCVNFRMLEELAMEFSNNKSKQQI